MGNSCYSKPVNIPYCAICMKHITLEQKRYFYCDNCKRKYHCMCYPVEGTNCCQKCIACNHEPLELITRTDVNSKSFKHRSTI